MVLERKQTGTQPVTRTRYIQPVYDDNGELLTDGYYEEYTEEIPVYGTVYRDATPEEIAEAEAMRLEVELAELNEPPTIDERMTDAENALIELAGLIDEMLGGQ